ncbi:MAG: DUF1778 domain-containing protein [Capsulimonas sp.]|uniref:type II toxin-antitoxin system TacA family antitoxin n=1 Tax=Capsulimonas sp. TaxID=2494211 RepID=UPI003265FFB5
MSVAVGHVHFRTTPEIKQRIADAAALLGQSVTDFIEAAATERAQQILSQQTLVLTDSERDRFIKAIDTPFEPTPALLKGAERVMRAVREGALDT